MNENLYEICFDEFAIIYFLCFPANKFLLNIYGNVANLKNLAENKLCGLKLPKSCN